MLRERDNVEENIKRPFDHIEKLHQIFMQSR